MILTQTIVLAALKTTESIFNFLCTPEGQAQVAEMRKDRDKFLADLHAFGEWFKKIDLIKDK